MNTLYIGAMANNKGEGFSKALKEASDLYTEINPGDTTLSEKVKGLTFVPDLVFLQLQSDTIQNRSTVEFLGPLISELKEKGSFVINWNGDIRVTTPLWMLRFTDFVTLTAFSNQRDINTFTNQGHACKFLQIGIDPLIYNNLDAPATDAKEIIFMANHYGNVFPLSNFRKQIALSLKSRYGDRFGLYGNGFSSVDGNYNVQGDDVTKWQSAEAAVYRGCKMAISISHFKVERYTSDRLLRIMGCGCLALTHNYLGIEKEFVPGTHLRTFNDELELYDLIDYYLEHEEEAKLMGQFAADLIYQEYTYKAMVEDIKILMG